MTRLRRVRARVRTFSDVWLGARMMVWACCLPLLKHVVPLPSLVRLLQTSGRRDIRADQDRIVTFARWVCRLTRWSTGGNCLERGLIQYRFLGAAGRKPLLMVGFRRDEHGDVRGHAWVVLDGHAVGESAASLDAFELTLAFGADGVAVPA